MTAKGTLGTLAVLGAGVAALHYTGIGGKIWAEVKDAMGYKDPLSIIINPAVDLVEHTIIEPAQEWKAQDAHDHGWAQTGKPGFTLPDKSPPLSPEHLGQVYDDLIAKPLGGVVDFLGLSKKNSNSLFDQVMKKKLSPEQYEEYLRRR